MARSHITRSQYCDLCHPLVIADPVHGWRQSTQLSPSTCILCTGLAVTLGADVGLDVEALDRAVRGDPLRLARRRFSPAEAASLEGTRPLQPQITSLIECD